MKRLHLFFGNSVFLIEEMNCLPPEIWKDIKSLPGNDVEN